MLTDLQREVAQQVLDDISEYRLTLLCFVGSFIITLIFKMDALAISTSLFLYVLAFVIDPLKDYLNRRRNELV